MQKGNTSFDKKQQLYFSSNEKLLILIYRLILRKRCDIKKMRYEMLIKLSVVSFQFKHMKELKTW